MSRMPRNIDRRTEPTQIEIAGLNKISIAVNANETRRYLAGFSQLGEPLLRHLHSVKVPRSATLQGRHDGRDIKKVVTAEQLVATMSSRKKLPPVWVDTKFSNDGAELVTSVDELSVASEQFTGDLRERLSKEKRRRRRAEASNDRFGVADLGLEITELEHKIDRLGKILPPKFLSILVFNQSDPDELKQAVEHCSGLFTPIATVSSSKQTKETNDRYSIPHNSLTVNMARMAYDAGMRHIAVGAADAELVRDGLSHLDEYDQLVIYGTGVALRDSDVGEHDITSLVGDVKHAVDVFVIGQAVLFDRSPPEHLLDFANSIVA